MRRSAKRFPGHLRSRGAIRQQALWLLLRQYDHYAPFLDACNSLREKFVPLVINDYGDLPTQHWAEGLALVEEFARRWNIDRIPELREMSCLQFRWRLMDLDKDMRVGGPWPDGTWLGALALSSTVPENPAVIYGERRWDYNATAGESLARLRHRIMDDLEATRADRLPVEILEQLQQLTGVAHSEGWKLGDLPHELERHVRWLFLRLCPQPDHPLSYRRIAQEEGKTVDPGNNDRSTARSIKSVADLLDVELPILPGGRPLSS